MLKRLRIGIVGATGLVGQELTKLLIKGGVKPIRLAASESSAGNLIEQKETLFRLETLSEDFFETLDVVFFCAHKEVSLEWVPVALEKGCLCIDNSSAYRQDENVPLIVPEINGHLLKKKPQLISNPNCSTILALLALYPLHSIFGLKRFFATTYQAASGDGAKGLSELERQVHAFSEGQILEFEAFLAPILFNAIPKIGDFEDSGYTREEEKMLRESRKILNIPNLRVSATCVRVPVRRAHSLSISAEFESPVDLKMARKALRVASGIEYIETPELPMPFYYTSKKTCGIGRLRKDSALENGLSFWVTGDQLWKGAALNSIQILETYKQLNKRTPKKHPRKAVST